MVDKGIDEWWTKEQRNASAYRLWAGQMAKEAMSSRHTAECQCHAKGHFDRQPKVLQQRRIAYEPLPFLSDAIQNALRVFSRHRLVRS